MKHLLIDISDNIITQKKKLKELEEKYKSILSSQESIDYHFGMHSETKIRDVMSYFDKESNNTYILYIYSDGSKRFPMHLKCVNLNTNEEETLLRAKMIKLYKSSNLNIFLYKKDEETSISRIKCVKDKIIICNSQYDIFDYWCGTKGNYQMSELNVNQIQERIENMDRY